MSDRAQIIVNRHKYYTTIHQMAEWILGGRKGPPPEPKIPTPLPVRFDINIPPPLYRRGMLHG